MHMVGAYISRFTTRELKMWNMDKTKINMRIINPDCCFAILSFVSDLTDMHNMSYLFRMHSYRNFSVDIVVN